MVLRKCSGWNWTSCERENAVRLLSQRDLILIGSLGQLIIVRTIANKVIPTLLHCDNCNVLEKTANILIKEEEVDADENLSAWQREGPVLTIFFWPGFQSLDSSCTIELTAMMDMFYVCTV